MPLLLRHILRPFHTTTLLLVAVFTLLFAIAGAAGLLGLPLFLIAFSWTFKYAYVLLEHVANGIDEPPVLSVEMVNPVEQRPLFQLAIILGVVALVRWIEGPLAIAIVVIATVLLPASTAILGASGRILAAANPIEMFRTMRTMGWTYAALLGVVAVAVAVAAAAFVYAPRSWVAVPMSLLMLYVIFSAIGGAVYEHRDALGLEAIRSPERTAARADREHVLQLNRQIDTVYGSARSGNLDEALRSLRVTLASTPAERLAADAQFMLERSHGWQLPRAQLAVAQELVAHLLRENKLGAAVALAEKALQLLPDFRPASAADTVALARTARAAGRRGLCERLLADFEQRFSGDARTGEVEALRERAVTPPRS